jgi:hypothetical protein
MAAVVYVLCALTSGACTWLLWRQWRRTEVRLLLFSALCFAGLTLNNVVLFLDKIVTSSDVDLSSVRLSTALAGLLLLLGGLIWEST